MPIINPQAIAMNLIQKMGNSNPMMQNLVSMIQKNDINGATQLTANYLNEQGRDFNKEFDEFMRTYGNK